MRKLNSYLIWLMPGGRSGNKLSKIILELSKKHKSPEFRPHVTFISNLAGKEKDLLAKTEKIAKSINSFDVKLIRAACLNEFFRSLFVLVYKEKELIKNHEIAEKILGLPKDKKFMPHLSLIYGNFSKKIKENIIKNTARVFHMKFKASSIYLVHCDDKAIKWTIVKKFRLKPKSAQAR